MFIVQVYTTNTYTDERSNALLDDYYIVGVKKGVLHGFHIGINYTVGDVLVMMGNLDYRPAHSGDVARWARKYLLSRRKWEQAFEHNYQTHVSLRYITELDVKSENIHLYL